MSITDEMERATQGLQQRLEQASPVNVGIVLEEVSLSKVIFQY